MRALCGVFARDFHDVRGALAHLCRGLDEAGFGTAEERFADSRVAAAQIGRSSTEGPASRPGLRIVADARIDGRRELLVELGDPSLTEESSDEDLILAAWCKWGEQCPRRLVGDYAFAIHDAGTDSMFCARDHVGARPFVYSATAERFAFASDASALLALPDVDAALDDDVVLTALLSRQFFPFERSWHRGIAKLPPGHAMRVTREGVHIDRYWRPGATAPVRLATPEDYAKRLRALVEVAVADRLRGAERVGLHLSGGLDSTAVAAIAVPKLRALSAAEPTGFSWHRKDADAPADTEPAWTEAIRGALGIDLVAPAPDAATIVELLRRDGTRWPDPGNLMNELPVQRAAAERGIDAILSGWGGDQAASYEGRGYAQELFARGRWIALWRAFPGMSPLRKVRRVLGVARGFAVQSLRWRDVAPKGFASAALRARATILPIPIVRKTSSARTLVDLFEKGAIQSRLETWAASGARHRIDYRYPLLDRRVLDFCYAIPGDLFVRDGVERWLMRTAMADLLPEVVAKHASKFEPLRTGALGPAVLEAFAQLAPEVAARRGSFARAGYVDVAALREWLETPRERIQGQSQARIALQLLDFPEVEAQPRDGTGGE